VAGGKEGIEHRYEAMGHPLAALVGTPTGRTVAEEKLQRLSGEATAPRWAARFAER
jgi:hypothetical protein